MPSERRFWWLAISLIAGVLLLRVWAQAGAFVLGYVALYGVWTGWRWRHAEQAQRRLNAIEFAKLEAEVRIAAASAALQEEAVETARARRFYIPDGYIGAMPEVQARPLVWTYKQEVSPAVVKVAEEAAQSMIAAALPHAASVFEALPALDAAQGRILLGYANDGPVWLSVDELLSVAMAGNSGRGKSRALLWLALQLIRGGVTTLFLDGKGDLRRWLAPYHAVAYTPSDIRQSVDAILLEADWRLRMAADDPEATFAPLIVILDELDLVLNRYAKTIDLIELLTKKTRSVNIHGIYSNQSVPADLVGGVATRGVIVSRICFYCDDEAARLIGVRANNGAAALLQQIAPPAKAGLAVVRTAVFGWKVIDFLYVDDRAVKYLLEGGEGIDELPPLPKRVCVQQESAGISTIQQESFTHTHKVTPAQRAYILAHRADMSPSAIAVLLWKDAHLNVVVRQVWQEEGAEQ